MGKCPICSELFDNAANLEYHIYQHRKSLLAVDGTVSSSLSKDSNDMTDSGRSIIEDICRVKLTHGNNGEHEADSLSNTDGESEKQANNEEYINVKPTVSEECKGRDEAIEESSNLQSASSRPFASNKFPQSFRHEVGDSVSSEERSLQTPEDSTLNGECVYCALCGKKCAHIVALASHMYAAHGAGQSGYIDLGAMRVLPASINCDVGKFVINIDVQKDGDNSSDQLVTLSSSSSSDKLIAASSTSSVLMTSWPDSQRAGPAKSYLCDHCNAKFGDFDSFQVHVRNVVSGYAKLSCPLCSAKLTNENQLLDHLVSHLTARSTNYLCTCCMGSFDSPDTLQQHQINAHVTQVYKCISCLATFDSVADVQLHLSATHRKEYDVDRCNSCGKQFASLAELSFHIRSTHFNQATPSSGLSASPCDNTSFTAVAADGRFNNSTSAALIKLLRSNTAEPNRPAVLEIPVPFRHNSSLSMKLLPNNETTGRFPNESDLNDVEIISPSSRRLAESSSTHSLVPLLIPSNDRSSGRSSRCQGEKTGQRVSSVNGQFKCGICDEIYSTEESLSQHKLIHSLTISSPQVLGMQRGDTQQGPIRPTFFAAYAGS